MDKKQKDLVTDVIPVELLTFVSQALFLLHSPDKQHASIDPAIQKEVMRWWSSTNAAYYKNPIGMLYAITCSKIPHNSNEILVNGLIFKCKIVL